MQGRYRFNPGAGCLAERLQTVSDTSNSSSRTPSVNGNQSPRSLQNGCHAPAGALIWHGRDLRRYRRLLSPPLQRLLTCPGTAALGRGVAVMPASSSVSPSSALVHLASDAVRAAAESPFLEGSLADASAVLCCIALPTPPGTGLPASM